MPPLWTTPPYRPYVPGNLLDIYWKNTFYKQRVDTLPTLPSTDLDAAVAYHIANYSSGAKLRMAAVGSADWGLGTISAPYPAFGYFSDVYPAGPVAKVTYAFPGDWFGIPQAEIPTKLCTPGPWPWFANQRHENAQYQGYWLIEPILGLDDWADDRIKNYSAGYVAPAPGDAGGDKHSMVWIPQENSLFETIRYETGVVPFDYLSARSGPIAVWDLTTTVLAKVADGSAAAGVVAAKIPVGPFMFTYQDLLDCGTTGDLGHMLGWTAGNYRGDGVWKWPARFTDGTAPTGGLIAGSVVRLKASFDETTKFPSSMPHYLIYRAIARTLKKYGMMLYDKNSTGVGLGMVVNDPLWPQSISPGTFNANWTNNVFLSEFEEVDTSSIANLDPNNIAVQSSGGGGQTPGRPPYSVNIDLFN